MNSIETKISPLIESMFPAFYRDEGENFILFVKAYFEWLEENHQLIVLEDNTNFNVGDTIRQENITGTVVAFVDGGLLVRVDGLETFKCFNVCSELIPVTSSSGGEAYILQGGTTRRLGALFLSRNLFEMRDIDKTLDLFIVRFKEKYLKNIEFDVETNKELLVKNSLNLYRAKGTSRAVDLFFRLIYGVKAEVYYPGDDIFRLSDGEWVKPQYLEISVTNVDRAIELVGQQVRGTSSGASAFVEKYIKRKIKDGFVHILYLSSIGGNFVNRELIVSDEKYIDSPSVIGSLTSIEVVTGSKLFSVGDIVSFNSIRGDYGLARVSSITNQTGVVDFLFIDGGYGYTTSADPAFTEAELKKRTQSLISQKVLTLANVFSSNTLSTITINSGGSGYDNTDLIVVQSAYSNATAKPTTNSTGGIEYITVTNEGSGFFSINPAVNITNSSGGATSGSAANIVAVTKEQTQYFKYFEELTQPVYEIEYDTASNNQLLTPGERVRIGNSSVNNAFGVILSNANGDIVDANGTLQIGIANNGQFGTGNTITLISNSGVTANVASVTNISAVSTVMGIPNTAILTLSSLTGRSIVRGDVVYQVDSSNTEVSNATVSLATISGTQGIIEIEDLNGTFRRNRPILVKDANTSASITDVQLTVGVYQISNSFIDAFSTPIFSTNTGTIANTIAISSGSGASFRVGTIGETEIVYLNTDALASNNQPTVGANQEYMTLPIDAVEYGFPKNAIGNSGSIILSCLNFDSFEIGTIGSITNINPGADYNIDPYVLAFQPYISGFNLRDYIFTVANTTGLFVPGERILQSNTTLTKFDLVVDDETGYQIGEKVFQGSIGSETATGIIDAIVVSANTIRVFDTTGTFVTGANLNSYIDGGLSANVISVTQVNEQVTAKGIVKAVSNTSSMTVKRIQFNNEFLPGQTITGSVSGATATIVATSDDVSTLQIGLNAAIQGNVVTANGSVSTLQVIDSGVGYSNGEIMLFLSEDGTRAGEAKAIVTGIGTGSGYYRTSRGFLSSISKVQDGDFYQEYSYEILSRIPLSKYAEMFKKVMHTAGTRYFGSVLLETIQQSTISFVESDRVRTLSELVQFNSNTDIIDQRIVFTNEYANGDLKFSNGEKVTYLTATANAVVIPLANNTNYYIANANTTTVQLITNPRVLEYTFNANVDISADFISLPRHMLSNNDVVTYFATTGNTVITELANNGIYHIVDANNSGVKLSATRGGAAISLTPVSTSENGHNLVISVINIQANTTSSGASTNGHFITHVNEI